MKKKKKRKVIFVFGSNLAGRHGKGAALEAVEKWGAIYGKGEGRQGNSYAIPTKDAKLKILPLSRIQYYVAQFIYYAHTHRNLHFEVTRVGCGLAGYDDVEMLELFKYASTKNIHLNYKEPANAINRKTVKRRRSNT